MADDPILAALGRLEEGQARIDGRLGRLEELLHMIRDDVGVNMAATIKTGEQNKLARDDMFDLTKQLSLVHRRLIALEARVDLVEREPRK